MSKEISYEYIEWEDAQSRVEWLTVEEIVKWGSSDRCIIAETGWIIYENKDLIIISNQKQDGGTEHDDQRVYGNTTKIPKTWIRKRKKIKI